MLQVVVDGGDQVGDVGAEDAQLVDRAVLRNIGMRHQLQARIGAALDGAHPHQLVENGTRGHVAAVALDERGEAGVAIELECARPASAVEELGVAHPAGEHPRRAVVAIGDFGGVGVGFGQNALDFLAGQPRQHCDARGGRLLAGDAEVFQRDIDIDALGHLFERAERHRVAQQQPTQGPHQLLERAPQSALGSGIEVHEWEIYPKSQQANRRSCQCLLTLYRPPRSPDLQIDK